MSTRLVWKAVDSGAGEASTLSGVNVSLRHPVIVVALEQSCTFLGSSVEDRRWTNLTSWASPERSSLCLKEQGGSGEGEIMMVLTKSLKPGEGGSVAHTVAVPELLCLPLRLKGNC